MITVHYLNNPPELRAVPPRGKSPVITDDGGPAIAESGAVMEYPLDRYGDS